MELVADILNDWIGLAISTLTARGGRSQTWNTLISSLTTFIDFRASNTYNSREQAISMNNNLCA